ARFNWKSRPHRFYRHDWNFIGRPAEGWWAVQGSNLRHPACKARGQPPIRGGREGRSAFDPCGPAPPHPGIWQALAPLVGVSADASEQLSPRAVARILAHSEGDVRFSNTAAIHGAK